MSLFHYRKTEALQRLEEWEHLDSAVWENLVKDWKKNKTNLKSFCKNEISEAPILL